VSKDQLLKLENIFYARKFELGPDNQIIKFYFATFSLSKLISLILKTNSNKPQLNNNGNMSIMTQGELIYIDELIIILLFTLRFPAVFEVTSNHQVLLGVLCSRGLIVKE
jgi:hypothetical protein